MISIERVVVALNFDSPDKVSTWGLNNTSEIFIQIMVSSKNWKPGWNEFINGKCLLGLKTIQNIKGTSRSV